VLPGNACDEEAFESKNEECRGEEDQGGVVFSFSVPSATRAQITAKTKPLATTANVDWRRPNVEVLAAAEVLIDRRGLASRPDRLAHGSWLAGHVVASHLSLAGVGTHQGGQDPDGGRLSAPLGPSSPSTLPVGTARSTP
jgi:hypothetical protein